MYKNFNCCLLFFFLVCHASGVFSQVNINNAPIYIAPNAVMAVKRDLTSRADIMGNGLLIMNGNSSQHINTNGYSISNLVIQNANHVSLSGNTRIGSSVIFSTGKIQLENYSLALSPTSTVSGMGINKFFETNGSGFVKKEVAANFANLIIPVGSGSDYTPLVITNTGSTFSPGSNISVQAKGIANPHKPTNYNSYLKVYWPINKTGITGGTTVAVGTYVDPTNVIGSENELQGTFWNGSGWRLEGSNQNPAVNAIRAVITTNTGELYAMGPNVVPQGKSIVQAAGFTSKSNVLNPSLDGNFSAGVYPNPLVNQGTLGINLATGGLIGIDVYDANGKRISSEKKQALKGLNFYNLPSRNLSAGTYRVIILSADGSLTVPFIKE